MKNKMKYLMYIFFPLVHVSIASATDKFYSDGSGGSSDSGVGMLVILAPVAIIFLFGLGYSKTDSFKKWEKEEEEREAWETERMKEESRLQELEEQKGRRKRMLERRTHVSDIEKERLIRNIRRDLEDGSFSYPEGAKPYNRDFPYDAIFDDGNKIYYVASGYAGREHEGNSHGPGNWYYEETHELLYKE